MRHVDDVEAVMASNEGKHKKKVTCSVCNGTGQVPVSADGKTLYRTCTTCHGTGQI